MERKWWTLVLVSIATFMLLLDVTVVNVALPDIQRELNASLSSLQWVVDAYSLMLAAFLLVAGLRVAGLRVAKSIAGMLRAAGLLRLTVVVAAVA